MEELPLPVRLIIEEEQLIESMERRVQQVVQQALAAAVPPVPEVKRFHKENITIPTTIEPVNSKRPGELVEFYVAGCGEYRVIFYIDNEVKLDAWWSELYAQANYTEMYTAFEQDGLKVFQTAGWSWRFSAIMLIYVRQATKFSVVHAIWREY